MSEQPSPVSPVPIALGSTDHSANDSVSDPIDAPASAEAAATDGDESVAAAEPAVEDVVEGSLEVVNGNVISGWAWASARPNSSLRVDIFVDGNLLVNGVLANRYREDLQQAGKGSGRHGFETPFPEQLRDNQQHEISVKTWGPMVELAQSPQSFCVEAPENAAEESPAEDEPSA